MHFHHVAVLGIDVVANVRHGGDHVHVKLAVQSFLHDLHVEQPQKSATETEAQSHRTLRLESEAGVVQLQFLQTGSQVLVVFRFDGIYAGKDHRFGFFEAIDSLVTRTCHMGDGVAHFHFGRGLDAGDDVSYVTCAYLFARTHVEPQDSYLVGVVLLARIDKPHYVAAVQRAVHYLEIGDDAAETIEYRVKHEALQRSIRVAHRRRNTLDDGVQYLRHSFARLGRAAKYLLTLAAQQINYLVLHAFGHGVVHVAFVQHGYDLQVVLDGHI